MKRNIFYIICSFVVFNAGFVFAGPNINLSDISEVKIFDESSNLIFNTKDENIIKRFADAIKSGDWYGSNSYDLNMKQEICLFSSDLKSSKWYVDLKLGYYAHITPPKLAIYRFKNDDFSYIKKILKNAEPAASQGPRGPCGL